ARGNLARVGRRAGGGPRRAVAAWLDAAGHHGGCAGSARAKLMRVPVGLIQHSAPTRVTRGLDPRVHHSLQELFAKRMDCWVKPAMTKWVETHMPGTSRACDETCAPKGQRVSTMKSVPLPVSPPI